MKRLSIWLLAFSLCVALVLPAWAQDTDDTNSDDPAERNAPTVNVVADAVTAGKAFGAFDPRLIPVELQSWWTPAYGHIHLAALVPLGQTVKGTLSIPVRVVLHDNPAVLNQIRVDTDTGVFAKFPVGGLKCANPGVCAWSFTLNLDTTKMKGGWREIRLRAETTTPDGKKYLNSSGIPLNIQNGSGSSNYNRFCNNTSLIGRGWYDGQGYTNAIIECVPLAPVKGTVTFRVRAQQSSAHLNVDLDKSHFIPATGDWPASADSAGTNLLNRDGNVGSFTPVTIDTTKLANGWHSLGVQSTGPGGAVSKCAGCPSGVNHPSGVAKMWFFVQN
jgi:hypothetical protein